MIQGLEHVGLSVSDLDRSVSFYRGLLGFEVVRILECAPEAGLGRVNGLPGSAARIAHLASPKGMLELFEYQEPRGRPMPNDRTQADHGLIHFGMASSDVRSDHARLAEQGVEFLGEPVEFRPGVWVVYFLGPDGEVCELRETEPATD